jgi:hypothetical protein
VAETAAASGDEPSAAAHRRRAAALAPETWFGQAPAD